MLTNFKKIKNKTRFYVILSKVTGCKPFSIQNNWFKLRFLGVPKTHLEKTEKALESFLEYERELKEIDDQLIIKYFGV